jgi:hypothetical protein
MPNKKITPVSLLCSLIFILIVALFIVILKDKSPSAELQELQIEATQLQIEILLPLMI